jgi:hypothetical protein
MLIKPQTYWTPPAQLHAWTHCIVHHSGTVDRPGLDADNNQRYHMEVREWRDAGYNFACEMVDNTPMVIFLRPLTDTGSHALHWNSTAVGVVVQGNFEETTPSPALVKTLIDDLFKPIIIGLLRIPRNNILPHGAVGNTDCPGRHFPVSLITDQL